MWNENPCPNCNVRLGYLREGRCQHCGFRIGENMDNMIWAYVGQRDLFTGKWEDVQTSVKAKIFEIMLELANERVTNYRSDLYHDALWIDKYVDSTPENCYLYYIVRDYGTHLGDFVKDLDAKYYGGTKYQLILSCDAEDGNGRWKLSIYEEVETLALSNSLPTDIDYSENEAYQLEAEKNDEDIMSLIVNDIFTPNFGTGNDFPTQGNMETTEQVIVPVKKGNTSMDDILRDLRSKLDEANSARDELEDTKEQVDDAISNLENYIDEVETLINSLDELPYVDVSVSIDVSFDSSY